MWDAFVCHIHARRHPSLRQIACTRWVRNIVSGSDSESDASNAEGVTEDNRMHSDIDEEGGDDYPSKDAFITMRRLYPHPVCEASPIPDGIDTATKANHVVHDTVVQDKSCHDIVCDNGGLQCHDASGGDSVEEPVHTKDLLPMCDSCFIRRGRHRCRCCGRAPLCTDCRPPEEHACSQGGGSSGLARTAAGRRYTDGVVTPELLYQDADGAKAVYQEWADPRTRHELILKGSPKELDPILVSDTECQRSDDTGLSPNACGAETSPTRTG